MKSKGGKKKGRRQCNSPDLFLGKKNEGNRQELTVKRGKICERPLQERDLQPRGKRISPGFRSHKEKKNTVRSHGRQKSPLKNKKRFPGSLKGEKGKNGTSSQKNE